MERGKLYQMDLIKTPTFVIHYSLLKSRRKYIEQYMSEYFTLNFVTEQSINLNKYQYTLTESVFGISRKLIGLDQGINSRSLIHSRRKSKLQGYMYYYLSYFGPINRRYPNLTTGSINQVLKLEKNALEVQAMHFRALELGILEKSDWIFVIEDDAVLNYDEKSVSEAIESIKSSVKPIKTWIDLNDGSGLIRTSSDRRIDDNNLFRVRPPTTRCAVAYLISRDLAIQILDLLESRGCPAWLYIDNLYQVATRKLRAKSYWQDPPLFSQGSDSGKYKSGFERQRGGAH